MYYLLGPRGFNRLPPDFVDILERRMGENNFTLLELLGRERGLFRQKFFRQPYAEYYRYEEQLSALAMLVTSLANQLGERNELDDAREFYVLALCIQPDLQFAHFGLANLYAVQGKLERAVEHVRATLRAIKQASAHDVESDQAKAYMARLLAQRHLLKSLSERQLDRVMELVNQSALPPDTSAVFESIELAIAETESLQAFTDYQYLLADVSPRKRPVHSPVRYRGKIFQQPPMHRCVVTSTLRLSFYHLLERFDLGIWMPGYCRQLSPILP